VSKPDILRFGPLGDGCVHLCVDMQRMFAGGTDWASPWMARILPTVELLVAAKPERTFFTRFVPVRRAEDATGAWRRYYQRWASMTLERMDTAVVDLLPELARFVPPARVIDKQVYSPWMGTDLYNQLRALSVDTLIISGGETDVCVLDTVLGAIDGGFRVIIATDALCSSKNNTHDALLELYRTRFSEQVETVPAEALLSEWK
jgi:nicotinamidase-related amidase